MGQTQREAEIAALESAPRRFANTAVPPTDSYPTDVNFFTGNRRLYRIPPPFPHEQTKRVTSPWRSWASPSSIWSPESR